MKRIGYIDGRRIVGRTSRGLSGVSRGMQITQIYDPLTEGYETTIGFAGKAQLAAGKKFTGGTGYLWGLQGQLDFQDGAELDQAFSIFAALRGVITASGTPVFTAIDTVAGLYCDNLCSVDLRGVGATNGSAFASFQNHGGGIDHVIHIHSSGLSPITNLFSFQGVTEFISPGTAAGSPAKMKMVWVGETYYINIYKA